MNEFLFIVTKYLPIKLRKNKNSKGTSSFSATNCEFANCKAVCCVVSDVFCDWSVVILTWSLAFSAKILSDVVSEAANSARSFLLSI